MDWAKFFSMGGYAFYVWGSYVVALVVMAGEVLLLVRRRRSLLARTNHASGLSGSGIG
jgi:heme exporter protein D